MPSLKPYSGDLDYSYAPGIFPCMQLMQNKPEAAHRLLLSERAKGDGVEKLRMLCRNSGVREEYADKVLGRVSGKDNCFAAIVFEKWQSNLKSDRPHVVLHHPMDEGNLGTIQRTLLGLGIEDIAIITPAADVFQPHVIRATMGAVFSLRIKQYERFEQYREEFPTHSLYPFMLDGSMMLEDAVKTVSPSSPFSLIFGNEGSGLPPVFSAMGQPVRIPHNDRIDSLNLAIAVGIGTYAFVHASNNRS